MNQTSATNLHSLWDSGLISIRLSRDFESNITSYYNYLYDLMLNQTSTISENDFEQWAQESLTIACQQVYLDENNTKMDSSANFKLGNKYYERNIGITEQRLARAGRRLSALLNRLAANRPTVTSGGTKLLSSTVNIIALISLILITLTSA
ncbi:unnamed protein product [Rotaria sp. Silwood2]|nr:unnamed protein product [Rotaria sp. Silwood2]